MGNPEVRDLPGAPWLFSLAGLALLAAATLIASRVQSPAVSLLAGSLLVAGLVARFWGRFALSRLRYARTAPVMRAFCGETVTLETTLSNSKILPLPWVEVWERLPLTLASHVDGIERSAVDPSTAWLCQGASLWPYQRARWRHTLTCHHRGVYQLADTRIRTGDPFGLVERQLQRDGRAEVVVYPRVVPLRRLAFPLRHPSLDAVGARTLVHDPTRTAALRPYQPSDPQRLVHWPTTARRGEMHVRVLEPAVSLRVCLLVDVRGFQLPWTVYRESLWEHALSAVASIAMYLQQSGYPVGLYANSQSGLELPPSASAAHLQSILEALARLEPVPSQPLAPFALARVPAGSAVVLATSDLLPDLDLEVARLEASGRRVFLLLAAPGSARVAPRPGRSLRISPGTDLAASLEEGAR